MRRISVLTHSTGIKDEATSKAVRALETAVRTAAPAKLLPVTGSRSTDAAMVSLLSALAQLGLIDDRTTS